MNDAVAFFKAAYKERSIEAPKPVVDHSAVVVRPEPSRAVEALSLAPYVPTTPKTLQEATGTVLRRLRKEQGLTLVQLSEKAFVSKSFISEIETGTKDCSSFMLTCIAEGLDVSVSDVLRLAANLLDEGK